MKDLSQVEDSSQFAAFLENICSEASRKAVEETLKAGIPITFKSGNYIMKRYPDGREEVICKIKPDEKR